MMIAKLQCRSVSRILSSNRRPACRRAGREATISLGPTLPVDSSDLPESVSLSFCRISPTADKEARRAVSHLILGLAPGGVSRASNVTVGAVSSYLAFSPLSRDLSGRYVFCDTFRALGLSSRSPPLLTGRPALWSSDFPHPRPKSGRGCPTCIAYVTHETILPVWPW